MAVGRLPAPGTGALRGILCSMVDPRSAILFALSFYCLLSVAGLAADVQVNSPDHNVSNQGNFTTESETNVAVAGSLVVVGYNSSKQVGLLGSGDGRGRPLAHLREPLDVPQSVRDIRRSCRHFRPHGRPETAARPPVHRGGHDAGFIPRPCLRCMDGVS